MMTVLNWQTLHIFRSLVGVVHIFMHDPTKLLLGAAKSILRYVTDTTEHGIWYSKVSNFNSG